MNETLATEAASTSPDPSGETPVAEKAVTAEVSQPLAHHHPPAHLETAASTEHMRHVPRIDWMIGKVEKALHDRAELVFSAIQKSSPDDELREKIERQLRVTAHAFERIVDSTRKHPPQHHDPVDPVGHVRSSIVAAVAALRSLDPQTFGRREPFHHFERSKGELVYAAVLRAMTEVDHLIELARILDRGIDEQLYAHLVNLSKPLNDEVTRPIA